MDKINELINTIISTKSLHISPPFSFASEKYPISFHSIGIGYPQGPVHVNDNEYPFFNLCIQGKGVLYIDDKKHEVTPGIAMLVGPGGNIRYHADGDVYTTLWISFSGYLRKEIFPDMNVAFRIENMDVFLDKFLEIALMDEDYETWEMKSSIKLYEYCLLINTQLSYVLEPKNKYIDMLTPAHVYFMNNISKPYIAAEVAECLKMSQAHMCRIFRKAYNCRPSEYAESAKISYAKSLMDNDLTLSVDQVAEMVGYNNTSYFIAVFKKLCGITPHQYKSTRDKNAI